jgi:hypothetical protein
VISLSFGDDAKVEGGGSTSRPLCVYLRLYSYVNVYIRKCTIDVIGSQCFMDYGLEWIFSSFFYGL